MTPSLPPLERLVPHRAPMILLDRVTSCAGATLVASVTIARHSLFAEPDGVPSYIGLEYMAQACAAFVGAKALADGDAVRIGFLLGTRQCLLHRDWFCPGDRLAVAVSRIYQDEEMATFDGKIVIDDAVVAEARLTVYRPPESTIGSTSEQPT